MCFVVGMTLQRRAGEPSSESVKRLPHYPSESEYPVAEIENINQVTIAMNQSFHVKPFVQEIFLTTYFSEPFLHCLLDELDEPDQHLKLISPELER